MIVGTGLTVHRGGRDLVSGVDLRVGSGELVVIVGPNGAGKSTLLRTLSGETSPNAGSISLSGRSLRDWPAAQRARTMGVLRQQTRVTFPLLVRDVVELGRLPHIGHTQARNRDVVRAALDAVGMAEFARRRFPTLSGGEQRLVDLARVLAQVWDGGDSSRNATDADPRGCLVLLDEPTAALDLARATAACRVVRRLADQGLGALLVLHDLNLASAVADRLVVLSEGRVAAAGPPSMLEPRLLEEVWGLPFHRVDGPGTPAFVPRYGVPHRASDERNAS